MPEMRLISLSATTADLRAWKIHSWFNSRTVWFDFVQFQTLFVVFDHDEADQTGSPPIYRLAQGVLCRPITHTLHRIYVTTNCAAQRLIVPNLL